MKNVAAALLITMIGSAFVSGQTPPANASALTGEWRSVSTRDGRPEATLTVSTTPALSGSIVIVGVHKGVQQWLTLKLDRLSSDGTTLTFDITLPEGDGDVHWTFRSERPNQGTLTAISEDASPHEDPITWEMVKS